MVFSVFTICAQDPDVQVMQLAFDMLERIRDDYFHLISDTFFNDYVNCIASFGNRGARGRKPLTEVEENIAGRAVILLGFCADQLAAGKVSSAGSLTAPPQIPEPEEEDEVATFTESPAHIAHWFPILTSLQRIIHHSNVAVCNK